jgi:hypothetical protein
MWILQVLHALQGGDMPNMLENVKGWIGKLTELGLLLIAFAIVVQVLIGSNTFLSSNVVANLIDVVQSLGNNGLVGLIALAIILWLFSKRTVG